jgi:hypothetical protein
LGGAVLLWEKINKRRLKLGEYLHFEPKILIYGLIAILLFALIVAYPPVKLFGLIPTPSYVLLHFTSTWRTICRIFVIVNIATISLSAIIIAYFYGHLGLNRRKWLTAVIFLLLFSGVLIEYQTSTPPFGGNNFGTFSYESSVPTQYQWLKNQTDINTIAEYPLERSGGEGNSMAYYLSMQVTHKKKLFNGVIAYSEQESMKTGLKNLLDPQTIPILKGMGVDAVVVHGVSKLDLEKIPNIRIIYSALPNGFTVAGFSPIVTNDETNIISLKDVEPIQHIISIGSGFFRNMTYINSAVSWQYLASTGSILNIRSLKGDELSGPQDICFDIKMALSTDTDVLRPKIDGVLGSEILLDGNYKSLRFSATSSIVLDNTFSRGMVLTRLGCSR